MLRPGGCSTSIWSRTAPFWRAIDTSRAGVRAELEDSTRSSLREIRAVLHVEDDVAGAIRNRSGRLSGRRIHQGRARGFDAEAFAADALAAGFASCDSTYEWFLGQATLIHGQSPSRPRRPSRHHLRRLLPLTRSLFKYLRFEARR